MVESTNSQTPTSSTAVILSGAALFGIILLLIDALITEDYAAVNNRCEQLNNSVISTRDYCALTDGFKNIISAACGISGPTDGGKC